MNVDRVIHVARVTVFVLVCLGVYLYFAWQVGKMLRRADARRRAQDEAAERNREERRLRLARLMEIAEEYDRTHNTAERQRLYREASALGFQDEPDAQPFALDPPADSPRAA